MADSKRKPSDNVAAAFAKFPAPSAKAAEGICKDLLGGGRATVDELIALVGWAFGDADGVKAKFALHAMALYAGRPGETVWSTLRPRPWASRVAAARAAARTRTSS